MQVAGCRLQGGGCRVYVESARRSVIGAILIEGVRAIPLQKLPLEPLDVAVAGA